MQKNIDVNKVVGLMLEGTVLDKFTFHTGFELTFSRISNEDNVLPIIIKLNIETKWWFGEFDEWNQKVKNCTEKLNIVEPDEPVLAFELAVLRWSEESMVEKVSIEKDYTTLTFSCGKSITLQNYDEIGCAWELIECYPNNSWSVICENGEFEITSPYADMNYSKEWIEFINKKKEFEKASFYYNNNVDENKKKNDLKNALYDMELLNQLSVIRLMGEGYIFPDSIELVLEDVVKMAITGHEECAGWAGVALNHLNMKKWKKKITELIIFYTECNRNDSSVFHYSWLLLYKLGFKNALKEYIEKYKEYMVGELDENDLLEIDNMVER